MPLFKYLYGINTKRLKSKVWIFPFLITSNFNKVPLSPQIIFRIESEDIFTAAILFWLAVMNLSPNRIPDFSAGLFSITRVTFNVSSIISNSIPIPKKPPLISLFTSCSSDAGILKEFVDYTALHALKDIGIKYQANAPKTTPIPWFNKHSDTSKKQTALQESESTSYVIGVMSDSIDYDQLPQL